ncbi:MAG: sulfatase, partial [Cyclobacteriaceae bacterium]
NDPYELNNLAPDPDYSEVLTELSGAMDNWLSGFQDTGLIPEADLIRKIWPEGQQPVTAVPEIKKTQGSSFEIYCPTEGASIAYKLISPGVSDEEITWKTYTGPVSVGQGQVLRAVAHRIGFLRSDIADTVISSE